MSNEKSSQKYIPKTNRLPRKKPKYLTKSRLKQWEPKSNINVRPTLEDYLEAERQMNDLTYAGTKSNGEKLRIVMIQAGELRKAGYRLAVGGDDSKGRYYTVRDEQGFVTLDGVSLFCLKGNEGRKKLQELIDKGFFNSPRLEHKDKL